MKSAQKTSNALSLIRNHWTARPVGGLMLILCCAPFQWPGLFALPPVDRDEPRFAEATRGIVASSDWRGRVVPQFAGKPRILKPPLTYWLQAPFVALLADERLPPPHTEPRDLQDNPTENRPAWMDLLSPGLPDGDIWAYRMASVISSIAAVVMTWRLGLLMFAAPAAWLGALLLGACLAVMVDAHLARADQILLAFSTLAQWALYRIWRASATTERLRPRRWDRGERPARKWVTIFWIAVTLGAMTKAPVLPVIPALTALTLAWVTRKWRWLGRLRIGTGLVLMLAVMLPWLALVAQSVGWRTVMETAYAESLGRAAQAREGHWAPPGYYLILLPVLLFPGSLALLPAAWLAFRRGIRWGESRKPKIESRKADFDFRFSTFDFLSRWRERKPGRAAELFCITWIVPMWLLFELSGTKLPHYTLPAFPAIALLCGRAVYGARHAWSGIYGSRLGRTALAAWVLLGEIICAAVPIGLAVLGGLKISAPIIFATGACLIAAQALLAGAAVSLRRRNVARAQHRALAAWACTSLCFLQFVLPNCPAFWPSARVADQIRRVDPPERRPIAEVDVRFDSLVFLTRGRLARINADQLSEWRKANPDGLVVTTNPSIREAGITLAELSGLDIGKVAWRRFWLVEFPANPRK